MAVDTAILVVLGAILVISLLADALARRTFLPRISVLVLFGAVLAPVLDAIFGQPGVARLNGLAGNLVAIALTMVAFLLGGELTVDRLRESGRAILAVSLAVVLCSALFVTLGLMLIGTGLALALLMGGIAAATDPAATREAIKAGRGPARFSHTVLGVVAIDDAWGVIFFGLVISAANLLTGTDGGAAIWSSLWEIAGGIALGLALGLPAAYLTGRLQPGEPTQAEAVGLVLLCAGLTHWLDVSMLLAAMTMGMTVANVAPHHTRSFREIENIEWPFLVFFFVFAGATLDLSGLDRWLIPITAGYIALRVVGRYVGGLIGGRVAAMRPAEYHRVGLALTPQAGVALGMALLAADRYPALADTILTVTITATVLFEIIGALLTERMARSLAAEP